MRLQKFAAFFVILALAACQTESLKIPKSSAIPGLAPAVRLNPAETIIYLADFFPDVSMIDSVSVPVALSGVLSDEKSTLVLTPVTDPLPAHMTMHAWIGGYSYSILLKRSVMAEHAFSFDPGDRNHQDVRIAGEMNGWNPAESQMVFSDGFWTIDLLLPPGQYQYQLVLDGKWVLNPNVKDSVPNNIGGFNSLLRIGEDVSHLKPEIFTWKAEEMSIAIGLKNQVSNIIVYWQNHELPAGQMILENDLLTLSIPREASKLKRSWIRVWAENEYGTSNDLLIPLEHGKVMIDPGLLTREDWEASVFYFLMVDRFMNGNPDNDQPVDDPGILPPANFYGGDLKGVTKKIEDGYFQSLGINTIWLSPITQNPLGAYGLWPEPRSKFSGYHGYWPVSSSEVDFRFGSDAELRELVETAHKNNMNVLLDYVANHVHELHPVYRNHPDWATELYLPDGSLNTERWDEHRLTTWFDIFLPTLDLSRPEVVEVMTDSALYWIEKFNLDGFRHDATKHIDELFWRTLTRKIKNNVIIPQSKRIYQVGETYGNRVLIGSYIGSGMLDAQFDFNVYDQTVSAFARDREPIRNLAASLQESLDYYGYHNLMGYITGNQDKPRFISLAGGDLSFDEDAKLAGWTREIGVGDPVGYKKLQSLLAFNMTIPGIPTIYYGDEIGMPGGNDPDNRRMMRFDDLDPLEANTRTITEALVKMRRENLQFVYGSYRLLYADDLILAYTREYFDRIAVVIFNKGKYDTSIGFRIPDRFSRAEFNFVFGSEFSYDGEILEATISGNGFEIFIN